MKSKIAALISGLSFFTMLGLVGACELGSPVRKLWWCIPLIVVMIVCGNIICKDEEWRW